MIETIGYKANKEMDEVLFKDTGLFRNKQIKKAASITLKSAYDEIKIYWEEELRYRPGFFVEGEYAKMPVFFSKINGVIDDERTYWNDIKDLATNNAIVCTKSKICKIGLFKKILIRFVRCIKKEQLNIDKLKLSKCFKYQSIRPEIQNHILEKLKFIIDNKIIKGTFINGVEYLIIGIALNLPKNILSLLHDFDFVKVNPKLVYIHSKDKIMNIQDVILLVLLHYLGFDVLIFTPNGLNCINAHLNAKLINEFQIGDYKEKVKMPFFMKITMKLNNWR